MKIAILGYGVEGESVYKRYHALYPAATFVAYDNKPEPKNPLPEGVEFVGGVKDFKGIDADIAVKTPAIAPWLVETTGDVTTMTREFLKQCQAPVIGVTGTKGKGTTSSLIKSILDAAGKKTWLVGNIGTGAFDVLDKISPDDIVIYELSSFQLWDADVSPHVAVILGIEPEHLDVHRDFDDYLHAKANIRLHQSAQDYCFYHPTNAYAEQIALLPTEEANLNAFKFNAKNDRDDSVWIARCETDGFYVSKGNGTDKKLCDFDVLHIPGVHNRENATAAISAAMLFTDDFEAVKAGLGAFKGLDYRIQLVGESDGIRYYNDSYSSASSATDVALNAVGGPVVLIAGGYDRGFGYEEMATVIKAHPSLVKTLLIGQTGPKIAQYLDPDAYEMTASLEDAVRRAKLLSENGGSVLLSPGFASFDMFSNFTERGKAFTQLVGTL